MIPSKPEAGMVLHYCFLWKHEAARGREEGAKERPVVVLVLLADGDEVVVAPITTRPPRPDEPALELPRRVRAHLGLNAERSWLNLATLNRFVWPGPDLRPAPRRQPSTALYGYIPQKVLDEARSRAIGVLSKRAPGVVVRRSED